MPYVYAVSRGERDKGRTLEMVFEDRVDAMNYVARKYGDRPASVRTGKEAQWRLILDNLTDEIWVERIQFITGKANKLLRAQGAPPGGEDSG